MERADFAVIGRGLMGTACARHLAEAGCDVLLIGPDEPADPARHAGPFGSFHDAGRITRRIAQDPAWARLSARSIARYAELERRSGLSFFRPCGALMAGPARGPMAGFMDDVMATAADLGLPHDRLDEDGIGMRAPSIALPDDHRACFDPTGGVIDPRAMRRAHEHLARQAGARVLAAPVLRRRGTVLEMAGGSSLKAGHVVLATGAWAAAAPLSKARPAMRVCLRTVALAEVSEATADALGPMPSLIYVPDGGQTDLYVLPPLRYPDGRLYIKIGGEAESPEAADGETLNDWFRGSGGQEAAAGLVAELRRLMPRVAVERWHGAACAVSFTRTGLPYIGALDPTTTVVTGGNGAGAKCADELGRLGAVAALGGAVAAEGIGASLAPCVDPA